MRVILTKRWSNELPSWMKHSFALLFFTITYSIIYLPILLGHSSLKTNTSWPHGQLFVVDPIAGGPITMPLEKLAASAWAHFKLPIINPYQGYGIPLLASQGIPVFPPEIIVHLLFPGNYSIWNVLRLILLSFGTYLLANSLNQSFYGSLAAGIAASLVGVAPPNINLGMLNPLMIFPYLLLSLRMLMDPEKKKTILYGLALFASTFMLALSGFQEVLPLLVLFVAVFSVVMVVHFHTFEKNNYRRIAIALTSGILGFVVGAIGLIPTLNAVVQKMGVNSKGSYLSAVPFSWLATVFMPHATGGGMIAGPQDMGNAIWILGTPVLALVIVLALFAALRVDRFSMWYALTATVTVVLGILGYFDGLGILHLFGFFPFNSIIMVRFFEFAWWLPWCLLLGLVVSAASKLRIGELLVGLAIAISLDMYFAHRLDVRLHLAHLSKFITQSQTELIYSIILVTLFVVACIISRAVVLRSGILLFALFLATSIAFLPKNFFSYAGNSVITSVDAPHMTPVALYIEYGMTQLPVYDYSAQIFGPVIPYPYRTVLNALITPHDTTNGHSGTYLAAPTLYYTRINPPVLEAMRALGVNVVISIKPLSDYNDHAIANCRPPVASHNSTRRLCLAGTGVTNGVSHPIRLFVYTIPRASPVIANFNSITNTKSTKVALSKVVNAIKKNGEAGFVDTAYITDRGAGTNRSITGRNEKAILATNGRLLERTSNTELVVDRVRTSSSGLLILRNTYLPGMYCKVNDNPSPCYPVDGGLWVAVHVPRGVATIKLDYLSRGDLLEFLLEGIGMIALLAAWLAYGIRMLVFKSFK